MIYSKIKQTSLHSELIFIVLSTYFSLLNYDHLGKINLKFIFLFLKTIFNFKILQHENFLKKNNHFNEL